MKECIIIWEQGWNEAEMGCHEVELRLRSWKFFWNWVETVWCKKMCKMFKCDWISRRPEAELRGYDKIRKQGWSESEMGCNEVWGSEVESLKKLRRGCCDVVKKMGKCWIVAEIGRYEANPRGYKNIGSRVEMRLKLDSTRLSRF